MFRTVRHWWGSGQGKSTVRLFAFEFMVVVLGVLVAQGVADWAQSHGEQAEGERLLANATGLAGGLQRDFNYWGRFGPCLRGHVAGIGKAAATGRTMTAEEIGRPALPLPDTVQLSADDWRKIRMVVPDKRADALVGIFGAGSAYQQFISDIAQQWPTLRLLDGTDGPVSAEDRSRVRLAAIVIDNDLRWMMFQHATGSPRAFPAAGIATSADLPDSAALVDNCGLLKDWR